MGHARTRVTALSGATVVDAQLDKHAMDHPVLPRLQRKTLTQQASEHLIEFIEAQGLQAGSWLPSEEQLARQLGVSRPVLREALRTLEATGIVAVVNGRGARVMPITSQVLADFFARAARSRREAILEVLEVRQGLEAQSVSLAAERRGVDDVAKLTDLAARMRAAMQDRPAYIALDVQLHLAIARASGNFLLFHLVESIREALEHAITRNADARPVTSEYSQRLHEEIVDAIAAGDPVAARDAMTRHFAEAFRHTTERESSTAARVGGPNP